MISSNATEETIYFFLRVLRAANPTVLPRYFMSDKDHAQMNAIRRAYCEAILLLCWWHVLHAWQQHFRVDYHEELWTELKRWIRLVSKTEFDACWQKIQRIAPRSVVQYLISYWLPDVALWSAMHRTDRNIYEVSDTNMLIEAYVSPCQSLHVIAF